MVYIILLVEQREVNLIANASFPMEGAPLDVNGDNCFSFRQGVYKWEMKSSIYESVFGAVTATLEEALQVMGTSPWSD